MKQFNSNFETKYEFVNSLFTKACLKFGMNIDDIDNLIEKLKTGDPNQLNIKYAFSLLENPENNSLIAGAILTYAVYLECPLFIKEYAELFKNYLRPDVYNYLISHPELQDMIDFEKDFQMHVFSVRTSISTYLSRLKYDEDPKEIQQMTWLRVAVGTFCSSDHRTEWEIAEEIRNSYYMYASGKAIPATPTIFNIGFVKGAPVSCVIETIADDLGDIYWVLRATALASKNNAGIGIDLSQLRHSDIGRQGLSEGIIKFCKILDDSTRYVNQGGRRRGAMTASNFIWHFDIPEFIRLVNKVSEEESRVKNLDISIMMNDLFFKRLEIPDSVWTLFCPHQTENLKNLWGAEFEKEYVRYEKMAEIWISYSKYLILKKLASLTPENKILYSSLKEQFEGKPAPKQINCRQFLTKSLMDEITEMQVKFSKVFIAHGCNINRKNAMKNIGPVRGLNLCQEITIPAVAEDQTGCCTLSSIALDKFASFDTSTNKNCFNYNSFAQTVQQCIRCLNGVIDETKNVSEKMLKSNRLSRPVGLGVSGFGDMCNIMRISPTNPHKLPKSTGINEEGEHVYEYYSFTECEPDYTEDALKERELNPELAELNWKIWSCMYYNALKESCEQAKLFGWYESFPTSQAAEGRLQYHLWREEEQETGRQYNFSLTPIEPSVWGQDGSWKELIADIKKFGLRNALLLTCMPTASSASLLNTTESVEFHSSNLYARKVASGESIIMNYHCYRALKKLGIWNKATYDIIQSSKGSILGIPETGLSEEGKIELRYLKEMFLTMYEIRPKIMIDLACQRQVVIDHTQSMNLYIANPTQEMLTNIHLYTNRQGLKTGMYYLRTQAATEAMDIKEKKKAEHAFIGEVHDDELISFIQEEKKENKDKSLKEKLLVDKLIAEANTSQVDLPEMCTKKEGCISCQ